MANDICCGRDVELQIKVDGEWVELGCVRLSPESEKELAQAFASQVDDALSRANNQRILDDIRAFETIVIGGGRDHGLRALRSLDDCAPSQFPELRPLHKPPSPKGPRNRWGKL